MKQDTCISGQLHIGPRTAAELEIISRRETLAEELKYATRNCLFLFVRGREGDRVTHKEFLTYVSRLLEKTDKDYELPPSITLGPAHERHPREHANPRTIMRVKK